MHLAVFHPFRRLRTSWVLSLGKAGRLEEGPRAAAAVPLIQCKKDFKKSWADGPVLAGGNHAPRSVVRGLEACSCVWRWSGQPLCVLAPSLVACKNASRLPRLVEEGLGWYS